MNMTKGVIIGAVGGLLTILATLLPWADQFGAGGISIGNVSGILTGFGTLVLIIGIIGLVLALLARGVGTVVCGVLSLLISLFWFGAWSLVSGLINVTAGGSNGVGYGTYVALVGAIISIVGGIILMGEKKKAALVPAPMAPAPPVA